MTGERSTLAGIQRTRERRRCRRGLDRILRRRARGVLRPLGEWLRVDAGRGCLVDRDRLLSSRRWRARRRGAYGAGRRAGRTVDGSAAADAPGPAGRRRPLRRRLLRVLDRVLVTGGGLVAHWTPTATKSVASHFVSRLDHRQLEPLRRCDRAGHLVDDMRAVERDQDRHLAVRQALEGRLDDRRLQVELSCSHRGQVARPSWRAGPCAGCRSSPASARLKSDA